MYQKLTLIGRLGQDPEVKYTQSGTPVTRFTVATSERWKDKGTGERKEETTWHTCEAWGKQAELAGEYLHKGAMVHIDGKVANEKWTDRDGNERKTTKVRITDLTFLQTDRDRQAGPGESRRTGPSGDPRRDTAPREDRRPPADDDLDDDIPFAFLLPIPFAPMLLDLANAAQAML
jgi:single-strand DNA-binding protein